MYVHIYIYTYIHMHECVYTHTYIHFYVYACVYTFTYIYVHVSIYVYTYMCVVRHHPAPMFWSNEWRGARRVSPSRLPSFLDGTVVSCEKYQQSQRWVRVAILVTVVIWRTSYVSRKARGFRRS